MSKVKDRLTRIEEEQLDRIAVMHHYIEDVRVNTNNIAYVQCDFDKLKAIVNELVRATSL